MSRPEGELSAAGSKLHNRYCSFIVSNENIKKRLNVESYHKEVHKSATEVVWPRKEARPRLRRKNDSGDGTIWEKKARKTEAEMDGLCQPRHESHRNDERRGP